MRVTFHFINDPNVEDFVAEVQDISVPRLNETVNMKGVVYIVRNVHHDFDDHLYRYQMVTISLEKVGLYRKKEEQEEHKKDG